MSNAGTLMFPGSVSTEQTVKIKTREGFFSFIKGNPGNNEKQEPSDLVAENELRDCRG
jgi:hypothetical protein